MDTHKQHKGITTRPRWGEWPWRLCCAPWSCHDLLCLLAVVEPEALIRCAQHGSLASSKKHFEESSSRKRYFFFYGRYFSFFFTARERDLWISLGQTHAICGTLIMSSTSNSNMRELVSPATWVNHVAWLLFVPVLIGVVNRVLEN